MTTVLVTGGTGSFGQLAIRTLLEGPALPLGLADGVVGCHEYVDRIVVFSRDELKQHEMRAAGLTDPRLRYFIGDIRDLPRLQRAMAGVDVVIHAAALKQVESCEYNPAEAVKTNVYGTENVIEAALDAKVGRVLMVGTDKAVDPVNLYGATKLAAEKLIVDANAYSGADGPLFSSTRYGNVISSRGAVLPLFQAQFAAGQELTVTDLGMTRFVLTLNRAVRFVLDSLGRMRGGEVFVPKLPAATVRTIAEAVCWPHAPVVREIGRRPGEKQHELLISENETHRCFDAGDHFVIGPSRSIPGLAEGYRSDRAQRLTVAEFRSLAGLGATLEEAAC